MCGRFTLRCPAKEVADLFSVLDMPALTVRYNIAPSQPVLCVGQNAGKRAAGFMRWGLVPEWAGDPEGGTKLINARAETVASKDTFRDAFRKRRCLIPADAFYEWKAEGRGKQPYLFQRPDGKPFAIAGLWERWLPANGPQLLTCCLITTTPNTVAKQVHNRMPVVFTEEGAFAAWLDPKATPADLQPLLKPAPDEALAVVKVSKAANDARFDGPECVQTI